MGALVWFLGALDYWLERYQELLAAALALIGVYFALVPAWRQVSIMNEQRTGQIRERLAAEYRVIAKAIEILNPEDWRGAVQYAARPTPEQLLDLTMRPVFLEAYQERKALWQTIEDDLRRSGLTADEWALIEGELRYIRSRFDECDRELEPARVADRETKIGGAAESHGTNYWFFCCEMPDLMVPYRMAMARELLEKRQADVVSQMVSV